MTHLADFGCIVGNMMIFVRTTDMFHMKSFYGSALLELKKRSQI